MLWEHISYSEELEERWPLFSAGGLDVSASTASVTNEASKEEPSQKHLGLQRDSYGIEDSEPGLGESAIGNNKDQID
jgi:hypothetical protein